MAHGRRSSGSLGRTQPSSWSITCLVPIGELEDLAGESTGERRELCYAVAGPNRPCPPRRLQASAGPPPAPARLRLLA
jgi:hypothetical protein